MADKLRNLKLVAFHRQTPDADDTDQQTEEVVDHGDDEEVYSR